MNDETQQDQTDERTRMRDIGRSAFNGEYGNAQQAQDERLDRYLDASRRLHEVQSSGGEMKLSEEERDQVFSDSQHDLGALIGDPAALTLITDVREQELLGMYKKFIEADPATERSLAATRDALLEKHEGSEAAAWREYSYSRNFAAQPARAIGDRVSDSDRPIVGVDPSSYFEFDDPNSGERKAGLVVTWREEIKAQPHLVGQDVLDFINNEIRKPEGLPPLKTHSERRRDERTGQMRNTYIDRLRMTLQVTTAGIFGHKTLEERRGDGNLHVSEGRTDTHLAPPTDKEARDFAANAVFVRSRGAQPLMMHSKAFVDKHGDSVPVRDVLANPENRYSAEEQGLALKNAKGYLLQHRMEGHPGNALTLNAPNFVATLNKALGRAAFDPVAAYKAQAAGEEYVRTGPEPAARAAIAFNMDETVSNAVDRPVSLHFAHAGGLVARVQKTPNPHRSYIQELTAGRAATPEPEAAAETAAAPAAAAPAPSVSSGVVFRRRSSPRPAAGAEAGGPESGW